MYLVTVGRWSAEVVHGKCKDCFVLIHPFLGHGRSLSLLLCFTGYTFPHQIVITVLCIHRPAVTQTERQDVSSRVAKHWQLTKWSDYLCAYFNFTFKLGLFVFKTRIYFRQNTDWIRWMVMGSPIRFLLISGELIFTYCWERKKNTNVWRANTKLTINETTTTTTKKARGKKEGWVGWLVSRSQCPTIVLVFDRLAIAVVNLKNWVAGSFVFRKLLVWRQGLDFASLEQQEVKPARLVFSFRLPCFSWP